MEPPVRGEGENTVTHHWPTQDPSPQPVEIREALDLGARGRPSRPWGSDCGRLSDGVGEPWSHVEDYGLHMVFRSMLRFGSPLKGSAEGTDTDMLYLVSPVTDTP